MRALRLSAFAALFALALGALAQAQAPRPAAPAGTTVRGKVVRVAPGNDFFVVQTSEGKEVTLYPGDRTTYRMGSRAVQFRDLRPGTTVTAVYDVQDNRNLVNTVTWVDSAAPAAAPPSAAAPAPAPAGTTFEGSIVRVEGTDQVVVRTADGKEMVFYAEPQTVYRLDNRVVRFSDLQARTPVTVTYDLRDRRPIARSIIGGPRRGR